MTGPTRRRINLVLAWVYLAVIGPAGAYLLVFEEELWTRIAVFVLFVISVETSAFTHFAAAAADTPTGDDGSG